MMTLNACKANSVITKNAPNLGAILNHLFYIFKHLINRLPAVHLCHRHALGTEKIQNRLLGRHTLYFQSLGQCLNIIILPNNQFTAALWTNR